MQKLLFSDEEEAPKVVNVASVPQRSPFRYPGGKTWFVPRLRQWLSSQLEKPTLLVEPFVGGGIISLTAVFENLVDAAWMVELDADMAAVWETIIDGNVERLAEQILAFDMTRDAAVKIIQQKDISIQERAFQTIVKNRTFHGGIMAPGTGLLKNGEAGKGIRSRWYPETLARRLRNIQLVKSKLTFEHGDAFEVMERFSNREDTVYFIDPPYTAGGKNAGSRLYTHSVINHEKLFEDCSRLKGDFILTYDNAPEVRDLAKRFDFMAKPISMKNTHHAKMTELVIGRNLDWMSGIDRVLEEEVPYPSR
ncbi:MAG: DNA adenine methylase [Kiritimatiellae bacterium]|jgi:DNA adenine methylase|nr:DNA adenine methylase [Kiritimatiellia bacterium]